MWGETVSKNFDVLGCYIESMTATFLFLNSKEKVDNLNYVA